MQTTELNSRFDYAALLLRLSLGSMYLAHAGLKFFTFTLAGTAQFFESAGFPGWSAYVVAFAELGAGVLLILGWQTRWVSLALVPVLFGATTVHWGNGWVFTANGGGWEYPVFLIIASIVQSLLGDGAFALGRVRMLRTLPIASEPASVQSFVR
jgi:putative oxidoreductase